MSNNFTISKLINLRYCIDHVKSHLHSVTSVIPVRFRQTRHAVVAVTENFDTQTFVILKGLK